MRNVIFVVFNQDTLASMVVRLFDLWKSWCLSRWRRGSCRRTGCGGVVVQCQAVGGELGVVAMLLELLTAERHLAEVDLARIGNIDNSGGRQTHHYAAALPACTVLSQRRHFHLVQRDLPKSIKNVLKNEGSTNHLLNLNVSP